MVRPTPFPELWAQVAPLIPRAWEQVVTELACMPPSSSDIEAMREKARAGHAEHGGDVVTFDRARFRAEQAAEMHDLVVYRAYELALLGPESPSGNISPDSTERTP